MSMKKNKFKSIAASEPAVVKQRETNSAHAKEYALISQDLKRVVVLNIIIFAAVLAVYFTDKNTGYLQRIYENLF
jgi:hypothetical protein